MALAAACARIEAGGAATLTSHAAFLAAHPPTMEARVVDGSSWSCAHGVERWRADCGCRAGRHHGWDSALAGSLAGGARLAARHRGPALRGPGGRAAQGSLGRPRRLRGGAPRSDPRVRDGLPRPSRAPPAGCRRPRPGAPVPRAPAPPPADVHVVRLVLRRDLRDRDRPGAPVRGPGAPARAGSRRRRGARGGAPSSPRGRAVEPPGASGRRRSVATARGALRDRPGARRRALRDRGAHRGLRRSGRDPRVPGGAAPVGSGGGRRRVPVHRPREGDRARDGGERGGRRGGAG